MCQRTVTSTLTRTMCNTRSFKLRVRDTDNECKTRKLMDCSGLDNLAGLVTTKGQLLLIVGSFLWMVYKLSERVNKPDRYIPKADGSDSCKDSTEDSKSDSNSDSCDCGGTGCADCIIFGRSDSC